MHGWLYQQTGYALLECVADRKLRYSFEEAHNRKSITLRDKQLLRPIAANNFYAVNRLARINWAKSFCEEIEKEFELGPRKPVPDQPVFFLTLVDIQCATAHDVRNCDPRPFIARLRKGLRGISYLGMLDVAYYTNLAMGTRYKGKRCLSWHIHVVCWGVTAEEMDRLENWLNSQEVGLAAIAEGLDAAKARRIPRSTRKANHFATKVGYLLKSPRDATRIRKINSGSEGAPLRFASKTSPLRPGERITLFHAMKHLYLDEISLAGGEGSQLLQRIKRRADRWPSCRRPVLPRADVSG